MILQISLITVLSIILKQHNVMAIHPKVHMNADPVEDTYIVVLKDRGVFSQSMHQRANALSKENSNITLSRIYDKAINGFTAKMTLKDAEALAESDEVAYIEQDGYVSISQVTWGLDRVDQEALPLDNSFSPFGNGGAGVTAYIIDTGIRTSHNEFDNNRARWGANYADNNNNDCNGHGTHVAGTVGGKTYGVAKNVELVAVKVLGCSGSGSWSGVIDGINWVMNDHANNGNGLSTANLSLGGGGNAAVDTAVNNLHNSGVVTVVAAGNNNGNACNYSPARASDVISVGSTTSSDSRSSFSNWGSCVDIMAPGSSITAAWSTSNTALKTISGTSMASPHVCGGAALLLGDNVPEADVANKLYTMATTGELSNLSGSPDLLLFLGESEDSPTASPVALTPSPSAPPVVMTDSPTFGPTESPTMETTDEPGVCFDSSTDIFFRNTRLSCSQLTNRQCSKKDWASHCPATCNKCEQLMCADSQRKFWLDPSSNKKFLCKRLNKMKVKKRARRCAIPSIAETCRASCDSC